MFRQIKIIVFAAILGVGAGVLWGYPDSELLVAEDQPGNAVLYSVREGDTLSSVLASFGLGGQLDNILDASGEVHDLSLISSGNLFIFPKNKEGGDVLIYEIDSETQMVIREKEDGDLVAETREIIYETEEAQGSGTINASLFIDASNAGIPDGIIMQLAEIFAWDVDFIVDIRKGDEFSVIYEKRHRNGSVSPGKVLAARFKNQGDDYFAFYFDGQYYDENGNALAKQFLRSPLNYSHISSGFSLNRVDPVTRGFSGPHRAIDYAAPHGTPVSATADGRVLEAGRDHWLGIYVKLSHGSVYETVYAHFSSIPSGIRRGARVSQGQTVGYVGTTGHSTGPHLHYELIRNGAHINPLTFDPPSGEPLSEEHMDEFGGVINQFKPRL